MKSRTIAALALTLVAALGAYWYWSPYLAIRGMQSAADKRDAEAFNAYVDYFKLRESLKGEFAAYLTEQMAQRAQSDNQYERAGSALGTLLGMALVDKLVDTMVRPEVVMRAMQDGKLDAKSNPGNNLASDSHSPQQPRANKDVRWALARQSSSKVIAYGKSPDADERIGVVLERSGFADWKLTGIRMPIGATSPR